MAGTFVRRGAPDGEQRHGHQLEGAVLRAHDGHLADAGGATDDPESLSIHRTLSGAGPLLDDAGSGERVAPWST